MMESKVAILPSYLEPLPAVDLVRLGREFDGGYVVSQSDVLRTHQLLSFGLSDDWSFEASFAAVQPSVTIDCYDHTVAKNSFLKDCIKYLFNLKAGKALTQIKAWFMYRKFFLGSKRSAKHYKKKIGSADSDINFATLISRDNSGGKSIFLKVDIEGDEYRILDQIIAVQENLTGIAIEFHDFDLHEQRIKNFVKNIDLKIVSVNINTHTGLDRCSVPYTVEVVFSKNFEKHHKHLYQNLMTPTKKAHSAIRMNFTDEFCEYRTCI